MKKLFIALIIWSGSISAYSQKTASDYFDSGKSKDSLKDYQGAIQDYTNSIKLKWDDGEVYLKRGLDKYMLEDFQGAIQDFTKAIELGIKAIHPMYKNGVNASVYKIRGLSKARLKDYYGAIQDFNKVIELQPKEADAYEERGMAKIFLNENGKGAGCLDLSKAGELGGSNAYELIKKYCQ